MGVEDGLIIHVRCTHDDGERSLFIREDEDLPPENAVLGTLSREIDAHTLLLFPANIEKMPRSSNG